MKKSRSLSIEEILSVLPHRQPFVMIDRVLEYHEAEGPSREGQKVVALKNLTYNESFFAGHFPHRPVMPGVLIIEALAQAGVMACHKPGETQKDVAIARISECRIRRPVVPGDALILKAHVTKDRGKMVVIQTLAEVDGDLVTEIEILASVMPVRSQ